MASLWHVSLLLAGTGPAEAADPSCPCAGCVWTRAHEPARAPLRLTSPDGTELDAASPPVVVRIGSSVLLWAPDAVLPALSEHADLAVLTPAADDASLLGLGHALARLRSSGALRPDARVAVAGLSHRHPRPDRLPEILAGWGVSRPVDRTDLRGLPHLPGLAGLTRRTLLLGPASSGKSALAESLLAAEPTVTYLATGPQPGPGDAEWANRLARHRQRRPEWWRTVETTDPARHLGDAVPALLDSVGTWLTAALDDVAAWEQAAGWRERLRQRVEALVRAWRERTAPLVAVSDEVGWGVVPPTPAGRLFREELGTLNARLAAESDRVLLVTAGRISEL